MCEMLVNAEEMKSADRKTIEEYLISEEVLIENAAMAALFACPEVKTARIFAGVGNNASDGYALARHLALKGVQVEIITLEESKSRNKEIAEKLGIKITPFEEMKDRETELLVDALFGTGLSREVSGKAEKMISYMNEKKGFHLALDVPSGISCDTGEVLGIAFKADKTICFGFLKAGLFQYPGAEYAEEVVLAHISIPRETIKDTRKYLVDKVFLAERKKDSNKGNFGHILCVAGSKGMSGAAYLAAKAAIKTGAGLMSLVVPEIILPLVAPKIPEVMCYGAHHDGKSFSKEAINEIKELKDKATVLLIGPGIRNTEETAYLVKEAISLFKGKNIVIDADGLNVLASSPEYFKGTVITPHPGEMARLLKCDIASVQKDRRKSAVAFAQKYDCTVVLKGAYTITAYPDGRAFYNKSGNPGMAKGGSGDVLSGMISSLMAQGIADAPHKAAFIHGLAGDLCKEEFSENSFSATDIIKKIPHAIKACK